MLNRRVQIRVQGTVQGVGFRPFVYRLAQELTLNGFVLNDSAGVLIEAQGDPPAIDSFLLQLKSSAPALAEVQSLQVIEQVPLPRESGFRIVASRMAYDAATSIPPDTAICQECARELDDPQNRRFQYPFINCTQCGPRYTIIQDLPYDRAQTTMAGFRQCPLCLAEYRDPKSRRFHAEPNACPECGPQVWLVDSRADLFEWDQPCGLQAAEAIEGARRRIQQGQCLAIKGVGGFHLAVDATNDVAVQSLRAAKQRGDKPFAVMVADAATARSLVDLTDSAARLLLSIASPIVLVPRRKEARISPAVAPGHRNLGLMMAYTPLHRLLVRPGDVWVMTSGNLTDEPIAISNRDAWQRLRPLADGFIFHNRDIQTVCDDSVVQESMDKPLPIRRARGYAPQPIALPEEGPSILAIGGEIKTALGIAQSNRAILSQHLGDMGSPLTMAALEQCYQHLCRVFRWQPERVVADRHPGYLSSTWGQRLAAKLGIPFQTVQHHHAHVAALLAEKQWSGPIVACCFDGTGYGDDGAIWGGEWLVADRAQFRRCAHLDYVPLPGGDACIKRPIRSAWAYCWAAGIGDAESRLAAIAQFPAERKLVRQQLERDLNCVPCSSLGRLFDAVAALGGIRLTVDYEGQAAMELESLAWQAMARQPQVDIPVFPWTCRPGDPLRLDWRPMIGEILQQFHSGVQPSELALRFHVTLAAMTAEISGQICAREGISQVGLTGGVFQNQLLLQLTVQRLQALGLQPMWHERVPPNDGGLALGQLAIARAGGLDVTGVRKS